MSWMGTLRYLKINVTDFMKGRTLFGDYYGFSEISMTLRSFVWITYPKYLKPDLKTHVFLHILLSLAILKDTNGILDSPDTHFIKK